MYDNDNNDILFLKKTKSQNLMIFWKTYTFIKIQNSNIIIRNAVTYIIMLIQKGEKIEINIKKEYPKYNQTEGQSEIKLNYCNENEISKTWNN